MKAKASLTLSEDLIAEIDKLAGSKMSRSAFVEQVLRELIDRRTQARRAARDIATINRHAAALNAEMNDVLSFRAKPKSEKLLRAPKPVRLRRGALLTLPDMESAIDSGRE
jgi:Arc/MetJ-type ribon-helix-helix transcriptional regulator